MKREKVLVPEDALARQRDFEAKIKEMFAAREAHPVACVDTFGCQQNVADGQKLMGMLADCGFTFTQDAKEADLVILNTCAVREHAEQRVFGNLGILTHSKKENPEQVIALCGCMAQEERVAKRVKESYRHVDLVFGPHALWKFPELLWQVYETRKRVFAVDNEDGTIAEGIPTVREKGVKAWVSIMYGCNNFCSYCIVPYVRGRERSRDPQCVLQEVRELVEAGYKDITLLGQNVNSYGNDLGLDYHFPDLLEDIDKIPGEYLIRFMSSHPKDATNRLFDVMAKCSHVAKQLHLPFQSGNDRVLKEMNRRYTREQYLAEINYAKKVMPGLVLTSDVIIGFGGHGHRVPGGGGGLRRPLHLHLFPPPRHQGGLHAGPRHPGGKAEVVRQAAGGPERQLRPASRRLCGQDRPGAGGRRERRRKLPPCLPHRGQPAGAPEGRQRADRTVHRREGDRQQHLGAVRRAGVIFPK